MRDSYIHVRLKSGAVARVSPSIKAETLEALDELMQTALENGERRTRRSREFTERPYRSTRRRDSRRQWKGRKPYEG